MNRYGSKPASSNNIVIPKTCEDIEQRTHLDDDLDNPYIREEKARKYHERMREIMTVDVPEGIVKSLRKGLGLTRGQLTAGLEERLTGNNGWSRTWNSIKDLFFYLRPSRAKNIPINFAAVENRMRDLYDARKKGEDFKAWSFKCKNPYCANFPSTLDLECRQQYEYMLTYGAVNRPDASHGKKGILKSEYILISRNKKNPLNVNLIYLDEMNRTDKPGEDVCDFEFTYYLKSRKADHEDIKDPSCYYNKDIHNIPRFRIQQLGSIWQKYIIDSKTKEAPSLRMIMEYLLFGKDFTSNHQEKSEFG